MSSQWYRKVPDAEMGPLTFAELVQLVRAGKLGDDDLVRRAEQSKWQRAREVIGLFHAAKTPTHPGESSAPAGEGTEKASGGRAPIRRELVPPGEPPARSAHAAECEEPLSQAGRPRELGNPAIAATCVGLMFLLALASAGWYWYQEATRFPVPPGTRVQSPSGHFVFGWGPLTMIELVLVCIDACVVTGTILYFAVRASRGKFDPNAES